MEHISMIRLPRDIVRKILGYLSNKHMPNIMLSCRTFHVLSALDIQKRKCHYLLRDFAISHQDFNIQATTTLSNDIYYHVASKGYLLFLQWLCKERQEQIKNTDLWLYVFERAAANGHLDILKWLSKQGLRCNEMTSAGDMASTNGHLHVVMWLHKKKSTFSHMAMDAAIRYNHWNIVSFLDKQNTRPTSRALEYIVGQLYELRDHEVEVHPDYWQRRAEDEQVRPRLLDPDEEKAIERVKWLFNRYPETVKDCFMKALDRKLYALASLLYKLEPKKSIDRWQYRKLNHKQRLFVKYIGAHVHDEQILGHLLCDQRWDEALSINIRQTIQTEDLDTVIRHGRLDILIWCLKHHDVQTNVNSWYIAAVQSAHIHIMEWLENTYDITYIEGALENAALNGHLDVCKYLMKFKPKTNAVDQAIMFDHIVTYLLSHDQNYTTVAIQECIRLGKMNILVLLRYDITLNLFVSAAMYNRIDIFMYFYDQQPEDMGPVLRSCNINLLKVIHEKCQATWSCHDVEFFVRQNHLDIVAWLWSVKPKLFTNKLLEIAYRCGHVSMVNWLHRNTSQELDNLNIGGKISYENFERLTRWRKKHTKPNCLK